MCVRAPVSLSISTAARISQNMSRKCKKSWWLSRLIYDLFRRFFRCNYYYCTSWGEAIRRAEATSEETREPSWTSALRSRRRPLAYLSDVRAFAAVRQFLSVACLCAQNYRTNLSLGGATVAARLKTTLQDLIKIFLIIGTEIWRGRAEHG